ncbi:helix-turn-helix domain-containing protein [Streptomyces sp. NPDC014983]|uniref:helix-turn-helix domain-containing protein n=1 Tax=Streptomyces sp. NPDC014983 TaxID=3364933 RepID=UPI0036FC4F78
MDWPEYRRWLKPEQKARAMAWLLKRYIEGASIRTLAEETGKSYGFIHKALSNAGVTLRSRGGARVPRSN